MHFHPDDFERLSEAIEAAGGTSVPGPHNSRRLRIKDANDKWQDAFTTGCGQEARFLIPYDLPAGRLGRAMEKRGAGIAEVCAVDDDVGKWPRFSKAMQKDSY